MVQSNECFFDGQNNSNAVMIAANVDQEASESTAQLVVDGLPLLGATEACTSSFVPFMCLYLFPLCDGNGTVTRPSRDQCIEISTVVCKDEWQKALGLQAVKKNLPDCASLPTTSNCEGSFTAWILIQWLCMSACAHVTCNTCRCRRTYATEYHFSAELYKHKLQ